MPWLVRTKLPLVLLGVGFLLGVLFPKTPDIGGLPIAVGILWLLFTGRSRRIYWNARLRTRASLDERASRLR